MPLIKEKRLIDNLEEFADKLLFFIADDSEHGCKEFLSVINRAYEQYNQPIESWTTSWFYQYTRVRGVEAQDAIKGIQNSTENFRSLTEFVKLVSTGKWDNGSFNNFLFRELIKKIPGYLFVEEDLTKDIFMRLNEIVSAKIEVYVTHYVQSEQSIKLRRQEMEQSLKGQGQNGAKPNFQVARAALSELQVSTANQIKNEADRSQDYFVEKVKLIINPQAAIATSLQSTFVLRGSAGGYQLSWIDSLGKESEIALDTKPQLNQWLSQQSVFEKEQIDQLKVLLLSIDTSKPIGMSTFKEQLSNSLLGIPNKRVVEMSQAPGRLVVEQFAIAGLFGHKPKPVIPAEQEAVLSRSPE